MKVLYLSIVTRKLHIDCVKLLIKLNLYELDLGGILQLPSPSFDRLFCYMFLSYLLKQMVRYLEYNFCMVTCIVSPSL